MKFWKRRDADLSVSRGATTCFSHGREPVDPGSPTIESPEGATGSQTMRIHAAPPGLVIRYSNRIHGLTPVATSLRPFGTEWSIMNSFLSVSRGATIYCSHGREPVDFGGPTLDSPGGPTGSQTKRIHAAPPGLVIRYSNRIHGLTPVATSLRPFGTERSIINSFPWAHAHGYIISPLRG